MRVRLVLAAGIAALVGAGCSPGPELAAGQKTRLPHDIVYLRTEGGVAGIDVRTENVAFRAPATAVVVPGFQSLFTTAAQGGVTTLNERSIPAGQTMSEISIEDDLIARVVSGSGKRVALMPPREVGDSPYLPAARSRTELVVANTVTHKISTYALGGNFEPEAFSTDDRRLYLIEYLPAAAPERYRVRILKLSSGRVSRIGRLKSAAPDQMRGTGRTQILAPSEDVLYTLYTRQSPNRAHGGAISARRHRPVYAFVHTLNLREGWAHCIDLPVPFGTGIATTSALATSLNGGRLFVADPSTGALAAIDPHDLKVLVTGSLGLTDDSGRAAAATLNPSGDTLYVSVGSTVSVVDATTLEPLRSWSLPGPATGLQTSVDGRILYVALQDGVLMLDTGDGHAIDSLHSASVEEMLDVSFAG